MHCLVAMLYVFTHVHSVSCELATDKSEEDSSLVMLQKKTQSHDLAKQLEVFQQLTRQWRSVSKHGMTPDEEEAYLKAKQAAADEYESNKAENNDAKSSGPPPSHNFHDISSRNCLLNLNKKRLCKQVENANTRNYQMRMPHEVRSGYMSNVWHPHCFEFPAFKEIFESDESLKEFCSDAVSEASCISMIDRDAFCTAQKKLFLYAQDPSANPSGIMKKQMQATKAMWRFNECGNLTLVMEVGMNPMSFCGFEFGQDISEEVPACGNCLFSHHCKGNSIVDEQGMNPVYCCPKLKKCVDFREQTVCEGKRACERRYSERQAGYPFKDAKEFCPNWDFFTWMGRDRIL